MQAKPEPKIPLWCQGYREAFDALSGDRPITSHGLIGPISYPAKLAYICLHPVQDVEVFLRVIEIADRAFVATHHRLLEARAKKDAKGRG